MTTVKFQTDEKFNFSFAVLRVTSKLKQPNHEFDYKTLSLTKQSENTMKKHVNFQFSCPYVL